MKYLKSEIGPFNLHIIKTEKFRTNRIIIHFKRPVVKEEITMRNLLCDCLTCATKKYNSERLMNIRTEELYGIPYNGMTYLSGNFSIMSFSMEFLNDKYIKESILEDSLDFMMDILFNPNVIDNKFDELSFNINKKALEESIKSFGDNPRKYSVRRIYEEMNPDGPLSYHSEGYLDDLNQITRESLYEYYKSVLKKDIVNVFIIGDFDVNEVRKMITSKMKINTIKRFKGSHYVEYQTFRKRSRTVIESKNINQSKLVIGCKLKNLTPFESNYVSSLYSYILGGSADSVLFKNVREKHSLCYYVSSSINKVNNTLLIESGIDGKNFKKTVKLIKKELKNMQQGKFDEKYIENGKITYLNACQELCDSPNSLLNLYISNEYLGTDLLEKRKQEIQKVTKNDIVRFASKVNLDTVYLLEGIDQDGNKEA